MTAPPSFTCPMCGRTSYHVDDVRFGYCGNCHAFTGEGMTRMTRPLGDAIAHVRVGDTDITSYPSSVMPSVVVGEPTVLASCAPDCDWLATREHAPGCGAG